MYIIRGEDVNNCPIELVIEKHHQQLVTLVTIIDSSPMTKNWYVSGYRLNELNIPKEEFGWRKHLDIVHH